MNTNLLSIFFSLTKNRIAISINMISTASIISITYAIGGNTSLPRFSNKPHTITI